MPTSATIHIQNTAPGPPTAMATATPATLPVPTREAAETVKARKAEMPSSESEPGFSRMLRTISGSRRSCTTPVRRVNQTPAMTRSTITRYQ